MIIRSSPPGYVATHPHPAWERFAHRLRRTETVLLIHAPTGTGRFWFARSWDSQLSGDSQPEVHIVHLTDGPALHAPSGTATAASLADALAPLSARSSTAEGAPRIAVVLDSLDVDWKVLAQVDWQLAHTPDLLLTPQEIVAFRCAVRTWVGADSDPSGTDHHGSTAPMLGAESVHDIHRVTGGWLDFALTLEPPAALGIQERTMLAPSLEHWIEHVDGGWDMAKAAYLEPITDRTLAAFFEEVDGSPPSFHAFRDAGLLVTDDAGRTVMPTLVRATLRDLVRRNDAALASELEPKAIEAVAQAEGVMAAALRASARQQWSVLTDMLSERWAEMFTADARSLRRILTLIPRSVMKRLLGDFGTAAAHILAGAKADGMSFLLPDGTVDHDSDTTAHRMRRRLTAMYRDPGIQALSFGLVEVGYLRIMGRDIHAAEAARDLLRAVPRVETTRTVTPQLTSIAYLHSAVALEFAGDLPGAYAASLEGYRRVDGTQHRFLLADCTSKLAVIAALRGDTEAARRWVVQHSRWIGQVGWGRATVGRSAVLARALIALTELDLPAAEAVLRTLPPSPDNDETWQIHALALSLRHLAHGDADRALTLVRQTRHQVPHPARAPLARQLLSLAEHAATLDDSTAVVEAPLQEGPVADSLPVVLLQAHRALLTESADRAASLLARARPEAAGPRWQNLARQLHVILGRHDGDDILEHLVTEVAAGRGEVLDLVLLRLHGILTESHLDRLSPQQQERLRRIPNHFAVERHRPVLTPREADVLDALRQGLTRAEIAEQQVRSLNTVRSQIRSLYQKLDATSLEEALKAARKQGL